MNEGAAIDLVFPEGHCNRRLGRGVATVDRPRSSFHFRSLCSYRDECSVEFRQGEAAEIFIIGEIKVLQDAEGYGFS